MKQRLKQIEKDNPAGPIYPYWKLLELTCGLTSRLKEVVAQPIDTLGQLCHNFTFNWMMARSATDRKICLIFLEKNGSHNCRSHAVCIKDLEVGKL